MIAISERDEGICKKGVHPNPLGTKKKLPKSESFHQIVANMIREKQGFGNISKFIRRQKECTRREANEIIRASKRMAGIVLPK